MSQVRPYGSAAHTYKKLASLAARICQTYYDESKGCSCKHPISQPNSEKARTVMACDMDTNCCKRYSQSNKYGEQMQHHLWPQHVGERHRNSTLVYTPSYTFVMPFSCSGGTPLLLTSSRDNIEGVSVNVAGTRMFCASAVRLSLPAVWGCTGEAKQEESLTEGSYLASFPPGCRTCFKGCTSCPVI